MILFSKPALDLLLTHVCRGWARFKDSSHVCYKIRPKSTFLKANIYWGIGPKLLCFDNCIVVGVGVGPIQKHLDNSEK